MEQHTSESFENLEPADRMKYEIAEELGIIGKSPKRRMEGTVIPGDRADWWNGEQKEKALEKEQKEK